nr:MFS transporter [Klebsiella michiganensis]
MASWVTRTPAIRDQLSASTSDMGWILFGLSSGSMAGLLSSNYLVGKFGTRWVSAVGVSILVLGLFTVGLGTYISHALLVSFGLFLFGAGMGLSEIAINIEGADVEEKIGKPVLAGLHGCFSAGTLIGAIIGIQLTAWHFPVQYHLWLIAMLSIPAVIFAAKGLTSGFGRAPSGYSSSGRNHKNKSTHLLRDKRLLMIGMIIMAMALAEGAANDWLPLLMVDGHGFAPASGSLIYAGFAAGMTAGRFAGAYFIARLGRGKVVFLSTLSCAVGLSLAIFSPHPSLAALSVLFWGMGASLGFPVAISAAGGSGPDSSRRVSLVATAGYISFLVGPPLLGFIGEHMGLRMALVVVLAIVILAAFMTPATKQDKDTRMC